MTKHSIGSFLLLMCCCAQVPAQEFRYKADIEEVKQTGFYRIDLNSDVRAKAKLQLEDIRIWDGKEHVPFVIRKTHSSHVQTSSIEFPIREQTFDTSGNTVLVIEDPGIGQIQQMCLFVKNNVVMRTADIAGSDDGRKWFAIKEDVAIQNYPADDRDELAHVISFPTVSYKYIRFLVYNNKKEPLNIVRAAMYTSQTFTSGDHSAENPPPGSIEQRDSADGNSYIFIDQLQAFPVASIKITENNTRFFEREAALYTIDDQSTHVSHSFTLSSDLKYGVQSRDSMYHYVFHLPASFQSRKLMLVIRNGDNPPLKIRNVQASHQRLMLYAYLTKGKRYQLLFGNPIAQLPQYDLERFSDSIPLNAPQLFYSDIKFIDADEKETKKGRNTTLLWTVIIAAIAVLGFFSLKLIKEMNNKA